MKPDISNEALLLENKAVILDRRKADQLIQKGFGEWQGKQLVLDMYEALYLLENEKMALKDSNGREIDYEQLLKYAMKHEKDFFNRYAVYKDMRERGYCIKTGFKFGFNFRVYPRGKKVGEEHTQFVLHVFNQNDKFTLTELSRMVRLAGNIKTGLVLAVVDSENDINYYEAIRFVP